MPNAGTPPFQYKTRAHMLGRLDGQMLAAAQEDRDRELEDFLAWLEQNAGMDMGWDFKGTIATPGPPTSVQAPGPQDSDLWVDSNGIGWAWNGTAWVNVGTVRGPAGPPGAAGIGVPPGGLTGQVLGKQTNADYATVWVDQTGGSGGGGGTDEVWVGTDDPISAHPTIELWFDPDAGGSGGGGGVGLLAFTYTQATPASVWTIDHPLSFYPNVTVIDSGGTEVEGELTYISATQIQLVFTAAFSGSAYLS